VPGLRRHGTAAVSAPAPLVGETAFGERYEIMVVRAGLAERVACVSLDVGTERDGLQSLTFTPDEARAFAADLIRWAGHAEREAKL
jgi:hypothetical protein